MVSFCIWQSSLLQKIAPNLCSIWCSWCICISRALASCDCGSAQHLVVMPCAALVWRKVGAQKPCIQLAPSDTGVVRRRKVGNETRVCVVRVCSPLSASSGAGSLGVYVNSGSRRPIGPLKLCFLRKFASPHSSSPLFYAESLGEVARAR